MMTGVVLAMASSAVFAVAPIHYEDQKLLAASGVAGDLYGAQVALDEDVGLIGAPGGPQAVGSAFIVVRDDFGFWSEQAKLVPADGEAGDHFGRGGVAINGSFAFVGAPNDDAAAGSVYLFVDDGAGNWSETAKLVAADARAEDFFGNSLAFDGTSLVIGAPRNDDNGPASGSVYVFGRDTGGAWVQQAKLLASDGQPGDRFGSSVAIDGNTLVVGAVPGEESPAPSGRAYVFEQTAPGTWAEEAQLIPDAAVPTRGYGTAVAIDSDTVVVTAPTDTDNGADSGSAYVFVAAAGETWVEQARLVPGDGEAGDLFGSSVALEANSIVVGAVHDDDRGPDSGSAYVYARRADGTWTEWSKLIAGGGDPGDALGGSVAIDGSLTLVGASMDDELGDDAGAAYVFEVLSPAETSAGRIVGEATWTDGNGHRYVGVELNGRSWEEARADLAALLPGYHLATVTSEAELIFLSDFMGENMLYGQHWLGGYQSARKPEIDPAADWNWVTGEAWEYTYWGGGEPNDAGGIEDHLAFDLFLHWNDEGTATSSVLGYIAELDVESHPLLLRHSTDSRWVSYSLVGSEIVGAGLLQGLTRSFDYAAVSRDDFDGDGRADLLVRDVTGNKGGRWAMWTLVGQTVTSAGEAKLTPNLDYAVISSDDFDGDAKADVLLRNAENGRWSLFLMDGRIVKTAGEISGLPRGLQWQPVATADFNGDGRADVLVRNADSRWLMYLMDGLTILEVGAPRYVQDPVYRIEGVADFNGDNRADILLRRPNGNWFMYLNDGLDLAGLGKPSITRNTAWRTAAIDDFNGDGNADVLIRNRDDGRWSMTMLDGHVTVDAGLVDMTRNREVVVLETADYNNDGRADILMRHTSDVYETIRWVMYQLDGTTVLEARQPDITKNPDWKPVVR
jgi:hypothetical protein